jgi:hypothetical protein
VLSLSERMKFRAAGGRANSLRLEVTWTASRELRPPSAINSCGSELRLTGGGSYLNCAKKSSNRFRTASNDSCSIDRHCDSTKTVPRALWLVSNS